jgi:uncharacterized protein
MAINYLIDTNIFLEILLNQEKKELCKDYLNSKFGQIVISDFSLHSIGVILFKNKRFEIYSSFINDVLPRIKIITLPKENYPQVRTVAEQFNLDFDDAYQVTVAEGFKLIITTMDSDFEKVKQSLKVDFLK